VQSFSAGVSHSCAVDAEGRLWTFGSIRIWSLFCLLVTSFIGKAEYGRLGLSPPPSGIISDPVKVDLVLEDGDCKSNADCGHHHTAAVTKRGRVFTWGWVQLIIYNTTTI
jgi:alpha-tubulin suppressor-like RCC1 family protein